MINYTDSEDPRGYKADHDYDVAKDRRATMPPCPDTEPAPGWANPAATARTQADALARLVLAGQGNSPAAIRLARALRGVS